MRGALAPHVEQVWKLIFEPHRKLPAGFRAFYKKKCQMPEVQTSFFPLQLSVLYQKHVVIQ